jgi:hypothetical protein
MIFNKKSCKNCNDKIKGNPNFCSNCGFPLKDNSNDRGLLGKNDYTKNPNQNLFSGLSGGIMNKMIGSAMKMVEKEIAKNMQGQNNTPNTKVKLMINGKEINPQKIQKKDPNIKILPINFSDENLGKWKSLERTEPKSDLKRKENKIEYTIEIPEVNSIKDISIIKLENSIEVRAIGKQKAYFKRIPIDLPLKKYSLMRGILTLELDAE